MNRYLVLLVDRKRARMFTLVDGVPTNHLELEHDEAPKKVKSVENVRDQQDKYLRKIDLLLHKHLEHVADNVTKYATKEKITHILIGGHKPLFHKIEEHLKYPFAKKVVGSFVTELKVPQEQVLKRALKALEKIDIKKEKDKLQKALS